MEDKVNICVQTGKPCGVQCYSEEVCNNQSNSPIILKDSYDVDVSEIVYTMPLFDDEGNFIINYIITKEKWDERQARR